jgi:histidyl-tRNA synthetase
LRDEGIAAEIYPDLKKLGKQLDYANALNIPYAIIIGENEMQSGKLVLKSLEAGTQEELDITAIIDRLISTI